MNEKIIAGLVVSILAGSSPLRAADDFQNNFSENLTEEALDALAEDLGAVMGAGTFHTGKAVGFPLGFDVGIHAAGVRVQSANRILRDDGDHFVLPAVQLEAGLPGRLNVIARGAQQEDATLWGGGLRLGLFSSDVPTFPSVSISGLYNKLDHDFFNAETFSTNLVLSFSLPIVHPYLGAGYDWTTLDPQAAAFTAAPPGTSRSVEGKADGYRVEAGLNFGLIPFTYLNVGAGLANGEELYHAGFGVNF